MHLCPESRKLAIVGAGRHVVLFKFKKAESMSEVVVRDFEIMVNFWGKKVSQGKWTLGILHIHNSARNY